MNESTHNGFLVSTFGTSPASSPKSMTTFFETETVTKRDPPYQDLLTNVKSNAFKNVTARFTQQLYFSHSLTAHSREPQTTEIQFHINHLFDHLCAFLNATAAQSSPNNSALTAHSP